MLYLRLFAAQRLPRLFAGLAASAFIAFGITAHGENAIRQTLGRAPVEEREDGTALIYIDRHLLHEVTSPQAFEGLTLANRDLWRRSANLAVPDHNVSTLKSEREAGWTRYLTPCLAFNCRPSMIIARPSTW